MFATRIHPELPIFHLPRGDRAVLYTPGRLMVVPAAQAESLAFRLEAAAREVVSRWRQSLLEPFAPECLTIHLTRRCNLACLYCFAQGDREDAETAPGRLPGIGEEAIRAAAQRVAQACALRGRRFHLVLHGGGEPTLEPRRAERILELTKAVAAGHGLEHFAYIATNGAVAPRWARWLAASFDRIGLSCDGPPDVQDHQRRSRGPIASSRRVEETARILSEAGARFAVRSTITAATMSRQEEIVRYLRERLGAREIRFEPVYRADGTGLELTAKDADRFVDYFLAAQRLARSLGCALTLSGARLDELHGPHCAVLQNSLLLTGDGQLSACFLGTHPGAATWLGSWDGEARELRLDLDRVAAVRARAAALPDRCRDCLNAYHCARECPEVCPVRAAARQSPGAPGVRCRILRRLSEAWLAKAAEPLLAAAAAPPKRRHSPSDEGEARHARACLQELRGAIDPEPILREWRAVQGHLRIADADLPLPVWARRGFEDSGEAAWNRLTHLPAGAEPSALSVYVHVPFCDRRCGFCNSYSVALSGRHRDWETSYADALAAELAAWADLPGIRHRKVTTVHFGGGTPNGLDRATFESIVGGLTSALRIQGDTEWAVESTSSLLTESHLAWLWSLGFRRLHVGAQTLEDPVRRLLGRREPGETVVRKLARALDLGFVTSVDLLYGLPAQSAAGWIDSLERLAGIDLHGFSVYEIQATPRNRRFLDRHAARRDPLRNFLWLLAGEQLLCGRGYRKTHFTHFARPRDTNLYYSHPERQEDLLALGPTADGSFGPYHYRHPELPEYLRGPVPGPPVLQGGVAETSREQRLRPLSTELMSGRVERRTLCSLGAEELLDDWRNWALVAEEPGCDRFALTASGSWFVSAMLDQVADRVKAD